MVFWYCTSALSLSACVSRTPDFSRPAVRQLRALAAQETAQTQRWEIRRLGHADLGVGGDQILLRCPNIGTPFEQRRGQAGRHFGRQILLREAVPAHHAAGVLSEQQGNLIFGLLDLLLNRGDGFLRRVNELFRLAQIQTGGDAADLALSGQYQRFLACLQGAFRYLQRVIEFPQRQVGSRHVADQGGHDGLAVFFRAQKVGAGRLGRAPQAPPDVDFKRQQIERGRAEVAILVRKQVRGDGCLAVAGQPVDGDVAAGPEVRVLIRAGDPQTGPGGFDTGDRIPQIVVRHQRLTDQFLQLLVLENFEPLKIRERCRLRGRQRLRRPKIRGHVGRRAFIIWAHRTPRQQTGG
jgi:hypothetical protein